MFTFFGGSVVAQGKAGLGANAIVPWRVDTAVGHADAPAAVDVDAIAIGIDLEVVDGESAGSEPGLVHRV
jgi:hypothetical protein